MRKLKSWGTFILLMVMMLSYGRATAIAENEGDEPVDQSNKYYLGNAVNTGRDTGFTETNTIEKGDPHYGWELGRFFVSGYTRVTGSDPNNPIILKNAGDNVVLWFSLFQDLNELNGDDTISISEDIDGYDEYFGVSKTNMGRGTLIIRHTDFQNAKGEPQIYTDYLSALEVGANTKVDLCEEGDYEVALDYEIRETSINLDRVFFWDAHIRTWSSYTNYRIFFKFSVRNGNCMVFAFDNVTGQELTNKSVTENGFRLDFANSHYLDVDIRKEIMNASLDGLTEDTRFNRPAKDGEAYLEEGIYTITVHNRYTGQTTEKKIYVGSNDVLKACLTTGLSVKEIEELLAQGATINEDGTIDAPTADLPTQAEPDLEEQEHVQVPTEEPSIDKGVSEEPEEKQQEEEELNEQASSEKHYTKLVIVVIIIVAIGLIAWRVHKKSTNKAKK